MALTKRQHEVLDTIREFIDANGYSPSLEEIGERLGLSSVATVHKHVSLLVEKGYVRRAWNQNRSVELVEHDPPGIASLPLCGTIAAGYPLEAVVSDETIEVPTSMLRGAARKYALRVHGDSMIDEQIRDGDIVVIEERDHARDGETVVALVDGSDATLKQLFRERDSVRLQPANESIPPMHYAADRVAVQGVVVGVIRTY